MANIYYILYTLVEPLVKVLLLVVLDSILFTGTNQFGNLTRFVFQHYFVHDLFHELVVFDVKVSDDLQLFQDPNQYNEYEMDNYRS